MAKRPQDGPDDEGTVGRRGFLGELAREIIRPAIESWEALRGEIAEDDVPAVAAFGVNTSSWLRPPSVASDQAFLNTCERSGDCIRVCPANAIKRLADDGTPAAGTPYIDPEESPCVVCTELACMAACPSGALQPREAADLGMGLARVDHDTCVRSFGDDCQRCVDGCPLHDVGHTVLEITMQGPIHVHEDQCVGCGCCQRLCPTSPRAIRVMPAVAIGSR